MSKVTFYLSIFFFCFNIFVTKGQTNLDPLLNIWLDKHQQDTIRLDAVNKLIWANDLELFEENRDSAIALAQMGYDFAESINNPYWMAQMQYQQAYLFEQNQAYEKAIEYLQKSVQAFKGIGNYEQAFSCTDKAIVLLKKRGKYAQYLDYAKNYMTLALEFGASSKIANAHMHLAAAQRYQGDYNESIVSIMKALKIRESLEDLKGIAAAYNDIGLVFEDIRDNEQALDYYNKSLAISKELGNQDASCTTLNSMANIYSDQGDFEKAIEIHLENLKFREKQGNKIQIAMTLGNMGRAYNLIGNYEKALLHQKRATAIEEEIGNIRGMPFGFKEIGISYAKQGDHHTALIYFDKALDLSLQMGLPYRIEYSSFNAYKSYKAIGNHQKALEMYEIYVARRDSSQSKDQMRTVLKQDAQYQYEKQSLIDSLEFQKEKIILENNVKSERNQRFWILGIASVLGILFFQSYRNAQSRKRANEALARTNNQLDIKNQQNEVLLKEIHHRVKNNLQTISSLLSLQSNSITDASALNAVQESRNRVASMAIIHQKLYQEENLAAIEMRDYFETIGQSIINSFNGNAANVKLEVDMPEIELDVDTAILIGLITNELITNSMKYAFQEKDGGKISIVMKKGENNLMQLEIADDGINNATGVSEGGTGFGSMLVNLLTTQLGGQLTQSTKEGTSTIIQFPWVNKVA